MRIPVYKDINHVRLRKRLLQRLDGEPRRLSTYRMLRSREFHELCDFYLEGIGICGFEQLVDYALKLEQTFKR